MRRLNDWDKAKAIEYNLRDGGTAVAIFADTQPYRLWIVHNYIQEVLDELPDQRLTIVELGCSAGDIIGVYAKEHDSYGYDVVPDAVRLSKERYPALHVEQMAVEDVPPVECDILILCEILEHIEAPLDLVDAWLPLAKNVIIGHPLVGDGWDPEEGHLWAYYESDFHRWFERGGHEMVHAEEFPMGYRMVIGRGKRK